MALAERSSRTPSQRALSLALCAAATLLGFAQAWAYRFFIDPDGVNYLDVVRAYLRHDFHTAVNAYWSPLYSWLLAVLITVLHPSPYWESTALHMLNFADYLLALASFAFFFRELTLTIQAEHPNERDALKPMWAWQILAWALFAYASLDLVGIYASAPDLLVEAACFLATGLILKIRRGAGGWLSYAMLGVVLAFGYFAKTVMFPLAFVFMVCAFFAPKERKKSAPRVALCLVVFLLIATPWLLAVSRAKGKFTVGEVGPIAYAEYVNGLIRLSHWHGEIPGLGKPLHDTHRLNQVPPVEEFAGVYSVTYAPWYDASYWDEGVTPHFEWRGQIHALRAALGEYFRMLSAQKGIAVGLLSLILFAAKPRRYVRTFLGLWPVWFAPAATLALYALVHVETRFLGAAVVILWCCAFASIPLPQTEWASRVWAAVLAAVSVSLAVTLAAGLAGDIHAIVKPPKHVEWQAAQELRRLGICCGEAVAILGHSDVADYWAHLAQLRIVAEVPAEGVSSYWDSSDETRQHVLTLLSRTGAEELVTRISPPPSAAGWQPLDSTGYYVKFLAKSKDSNQQ